MVFYVFREANRRVHKYIDIFFDQTQNTFFYQLLTPPYKKGENTYIAKKQKNPTSVIIRNGVLGVPFIAPLLCIQFWASRTFENADAI